MAIEILLIIIALASIGYGFAIVVRRFPEIANVNVRKIPEIAQTKIKRQILEDKLRRDFGGWWKRFYDALIAGRRQKMSAFFSGMYEKIKTLQQEYRIVRKKDLSSHVTRSGSVDDLIRSAREHIAVEEFLKAEQFLIEALKLDEQNVKTYTLLAEVYREKKDFGHAKETLDYLAQLTGGADPIIFNSLASLALDRGDFSSAQENFERCIDLDPDNYRYHLELAEVHTALGDSDRAQNEAQRAQALAPNNPKILDFLIENSIILQDKSRASEYLSKLEEVNPQNGKIQSFKSRIEKLES